MSFQGQDDVINKNSVNILKAGDVIKREAIMAVWIGIFAQFVGYIL